MIKIFHSDQHKVACILNTETEEILTATIQPIFHGDTQKIDNYLVSISSSKEDNVIAIYYNGDLSNVEVNASYDDITEVLDISVSVNDGNCYVQYRLNKDYTGQSSKITYAEMIDNFLNRGKSTYHNETIKPTDIMNYAKNAKDDKESAESNFFKLLNSTKKKNNNK